MNSETILAMPDTIPKVDFLAFRWAASRFFPSVISDEALFDPQEKKRQFDWSWQAVRYRYKSCAECNEEFEALVGNASDLWKAGWSDEELTYKLERCIYIFFVSALSVFESFGFCLYFLGGALRPSDFPFIATPTKITLAATSEAFTAAFPNTAISSRLAELLQRPGFATIDKIGAYWPTG